jgi:hypothetical protein
VRGRHSAKSRQIATEAAIGYYVADLIGADTELAIGWRLLLIHRGLAIMLQSTADRVLWQLSLAIHWAHLSIIVFSGGQRVDAGQPAVQIHVRAAAGTKGTKALRLRFSADGARFHLAKGTHPANLRFA